MTVNICLMESFNHMFTDNYELVLILVSLDCVFNLKYLICIDFSLFSCMFFQVSCNHCIL